MSTLFRLLLPAQLYREMVQQAQAELPNECCGLLAGRVEVRTGSAVGVVVRRFALINAAASPREFESDPGSMFHAAKEMREQELELLAIYHSHPTSPAIPSRTDLERNYSPEVMNLIISMSGDEPVVRGWWLAEGGHREAEVIVSPRG